MREPEGNAVVYCEGGFGTSNGKTAHGLVRRTERYRVVAVIDSTLAGRDAGDFLDGRANGIPVVDGLTAAKEHGNARGMPPTHFVFGLAPDGGRLGREHRGAVLEAIRSRLHVVCGLHDFLEDEEEFAAAAAQHGVTLTDVRKPPPRSDLHFFSGKIEEVTSFRVALLGTDSAVGKRTTAWVLVDALRSAGYDADLVGTGQTAWMQGARAGTLVDSLVSDFMAGEIEHAVWSAWNDGAPDALVLEGQGSLMNPAYPGGFELLAAGRPHVVVLQHAPARTDYDGFPGYPIQPLEHQIRAVETISSRPVVAVTVNHEGLAAGDVPSVCERIERETGLPALDPLRDGCSRLVPVLETRGLVRKGR